MKTNPVEKNSLRTLVFAILAVSISLIFIELVFRTLFYFDVFKFTKSMKAEALHRYSDISELVYEMKPSFSFRDFHGVVKTNSFGMRGGEYAMEKPAGVYRICVIGDSVAFGMYLPVEETFAHLLEGDLNRQLGHRFEVLNFSVAGYNASQEKIILKEKVLRFKPDMVIVSFCPNDDTYTDGLGKMSRAFSPFSIGNQLHSRTVCFLMHRLEKSIFSKMTDIGQVEGLLGELARESRKNGFEALVLLIPYNYQKEYTEKKKHAAVRDFAQREKLLYLDFFKAWQDAGSETRKDSYLEDDIVHLSSLGMRKVANGIYEYIAEHVKSDAGMSAARLEAQASK